MSEIIRLENLTKKYGQKVALNNISLSLESGKIIGLLGPNGSGKTTFIKLVNGLLIPDGGEIFVCGEKPSPKTKALVSYLPDNIHLNFWMTVQDALDFFVDFYEDFRINIAFEMLRKLEINPKTKIKTLSKGNKEKVCLILVMSRNAKLYILDEPIAGVDPAARDYVISTIINNYNPESAVVISTHLISDIEEVLDDIVFLKEGNLILHNSVDAIREEHNKSIDELFREVFKW